MKAILLFGIILMGFSCQKPVEEAKGKEYFSNGEWYFISQEIDSIKLLSKNKIVERKSVLNKADRLELLEKYDTLVLEYIVYACDCPRWRINSKDAVTFLENHYYIDAINSSIELTSQILVTGNKVRFIGIENKELGYPANKKFQDPNPPKGKVFKYYSYELVKPYKIWAGKLFDEIDPISGDSNFAPIQLMVE